MALTGKEVLFCTGLISGAAAAARKQITTQDIANLANGGSSTLTGNERLHVYGETIGNVPSSVQFVTTTGSINALGSIAPSILTGNELMTVISSTIIGGLPTAGRVSTTTLNIANS